MEEKTVEDSLFSTLLSKIDKEVIKLILTQKPLRLVEGKENELLLAILHCMVSGPRGVRIALKFGSTEVVIREIFHDFNYRGWLEICKHALSFFLDPLKKFEAHKYSPYYRVHGCFWPENIDIDNEIQSRKDFFNSQ